MLVGNDDKENDGAASIKKKKKSVSPSQKRKLAQNGEQQHAEKTPKASRSALKALNDNTGSSSAAAPALSAGEAKPKRRKEGSRLRAPRGGH